MDTTALIENLRTDLARSAEVGGAEVKAAAERLLLALDPAVRLMLMEALSQAASEIGHALPGVSIDVRLKGREPEFVIEAAQVEMPPAEASDAEDDANVVRITLRLPENVKAQAEADAARRGQSLNTWLVNAARAATDGGPRGFESGHSYKPGQRVKGWAR